MERREALRVLGAATAVPLVSRNLYALGRHAHDHWRAQPGFRVLDADQQALVTPFTEATPAQQTALLTTLDDELARLKESHQSTGKNFFHTLKWLTLVGYYT